MILKCTELSLAYEKQTVIDRLSFQVEQGEYLYIVGENGTGKSTLLKGILGLMKPIGGRVELGAGVRRNQIGYLPQQTPSQRAFPASVQEIVLSGCLNRRGIRPFFSKEEKARAADAMARMELGGMEKRCYRELSGGQQQRVLLARALCAADQLLLLDEPTAGLDPIVTEEFYGLIERINRTDHMTVLMVSHDLSAAMRYADHILSLEHNETFFGTKEEFAARNGGVG